MVDRLFIGALGHRHSGKSLTWNTLFGATVRTGSNKRRLKLRSGECVEVFLISGSNEERNQYAGDVLADQSVRIILCSVQYVKHASLTLDYIEDQDFCTYVQWLNPGYDDLDCQHADYVGLASRLLHMGATVAIRNGKVDATSRVNELREIIYGWASFRGLVVPC